MNRRPSLTRTPALSGIDSRARGGISFSAVLTGVVVAFGAMALLAATIGAILVGMRTDVSEITRSDFVGGGIGVAMALVISQLLAYMWGGYTAGRMSRGAGLANGLLVPFTAFVMALGLAMAARYLGSDIDLNVPFTRVAVETVGSDAVNAGIGFGFIALMAMFIGGAIGGLLGARWHTKLELRDTEGVVATEAVPRTERTIDVTEDTPTQVTHR